MFGATILVPIVVNTTVGSDVLSIPVALVTSGIGTLIYIACTRGRSPVYLGSSFAFIAPMVAGYAIAGKSQCFFTAIVFVGLMYVIISTIIRIVGKKWIDKVLPPVVVGPMIMIIGLSLAPTAIEEIGYKCRQRSNDQPNYCICRIFKYCNIGCKRKKDY